MGCRRQGHQLIGLYLARAISRPSMQTVLAVASEPLVLRVLCTLLRHAGYFVLSGQSAKTACDIAAQHPGPIDLLITDVLMPQVNGWELAREFHRRRPE